MPLSFSDLSEILNIEENKILNFQTHNGAIDYKGCEFSIANTKYIFRLAKVTPKKNGLFVTFWNRNKQGTTEPYSVSEKFDVLLILCLDDSNKGFFSFSKDTLITNNILVDEDNMIAGKRGFRVYPKWSEPGSKQALVTKQWQMDYFSRDFTPK
ncbi:MAG: MepB family protein [Bdellovibrionales bacterium]